MKKHLANIVSSSRIVGAIALFFCNSISNVFLAIYILCGFTDLIDGPIARKTNSTSLLGAILDTVGDVATYLALTKILIMKKLVPGWILAWILGAGVVFGIGALISKKRFNKLYLPHTYLGKLFGGVVFVLPVAISLNLGTAWMSVICTIASINSLELIYVQSRNKEAKDFVPTAFHIEKA